LIADELRQVYDGEWQTLPFGAAPSRSDAAVYRNLAAPLRLARVWVSTALCQLRR